MATYVTRKPSGLSIKRNGNTLTATWKISDKDYDAGQTMQYRFYTTKWGKWINIPIWVTTTQKSLVIPVSDYFPNTKKYLKAVQFRVRGKRAPFEGNTPEVSDWAQKDFDILTPNAPKISAALSSSYTNVCTFTWSTLVEADSRHWFSNIEVQTRLAKASNVTDGSKLSSSGWTAYAVSTANNSATITEDTSVVNLGTSYTRWVRVRARGPQGVTAWKYARHVYSIPYQTKNVKASASVQASGGYLCKVSWKTPRDASHPVDSINVQYTFAVPAAGMTCPDGASWTDGQTLKYKDGSDSAAFSIDSTVGDDQCLFVRINTVHDRNTTYGVATSAAVGPLKAPTQVSVSTDQDTHRSTITITKATTVPDAFHVVRYRTTANPNGFNIGIIASNQSSVTVQCPDDVDGAQFGVRAVVGTATATTRADNVTSYAVSAKMKSDLVTTGGTIPAAPSSVSLSMTDTPGTIRVVWNWSWQDATNAELSWADHEDAWESTDQPSTYMINNTHASAWNISGLETGKKWFVRVRLANDVNNNITYGPYSDTKSIDLSSAPAVPILTLSSGVIPEDGSLTASWAFASTDGTGQASAELAVVTVSNNVTTYTPIATTESAQYITLSAADLGWTSGSSYNLVVRVTSTSGRQSGWSDAVTIAVAELLTITVQSTSLVEQTLTVDGQSRTVQSLTVMPLTLTVIGAGTGGTTRVVIARAEDYRVDRPDESVFNGYEGETICIMSQTGESQISIGNDDLIGSLDDGASYDLICTVQDGLGQSAETSIRFEVHWAHQALIPAATVSIQDLVAVLSPTAPTGAVTGDVCDIYRLSVDKPALIYPGAAFGEDYVDPYPTLGEHGGYRFVFRTINGDYITANDELAWLDIAEPAVSEANIIDFGTGRVLLPYNVDLSHKWSKDFKETKYLGGSIQGDWNPAVSRTGTFSTVVLADEQETIEAMRRLAVYAGICHVRTKDGSSYAADVQVSEAYKQDTAHRIVEFSLSITRVDTEGYDGMTLDEWEDLNLPEETEEEEP